MTVPLWLAAPAITLAALGAGADIRARRIPNRLVGPALALALALRLALEGPTGLWWGALGALLLGAILLPGWLMGWMGAGDVKLLVAVGAWLGHPAALVALLASLMAGGAIAFVVAARRRVLVRTLSSVVRLAVAPAGVEARALSGIRFPFALAVLAGVMVAVSVHL